LEVQCYDHFLHLHLYSSLSTQFTSLHNFLAQVYLRYNLLESKSMYPQVELAIHIWSWSIHKLWVWKPCAFNSKGYKSSKHNTSSSIFSSLEVKLQFVHLKFQVKTKNWHLSNVITPPLLNTIILSLNHISLYGCPFSSTFLRIWRTIFFEFGISELSIEDWRIIILPYNLVLCNLKVIFFFGVLEWQKR
jgi:hypothetical protein